MLIPQLVVRFMSHLFKREETQVYLLFLNHLTAIRKCVLFSITGTIALSVLVPHVLVSPLKLVFTLKTAHTFPNKG